jgi:dCTP deaminase
MRPSPAGILVDRDLEALLGRSIRAVAGAPPIERAQIQPASLDLRLGPVAQRVRAGFLPGTTPIEERLAELATSAVSLEGAGAVLERGLVYLVPLEEELALEPDVHARFNPRSSTGRCDVFTRVLVGGHARFDETPRGWHGRLWLEVAPLSFPVRLRRGDRLAQIRLQRGDAALSRAELLAHHARTPLVYEGGRALPAEALRAQDDGSIALSIGLEGRDPCGWRAGRNTEVVRFAETGVHDPLDFFEPVRARAGHCVLEPERFTIFASRERLAIPPDLAGEMLPIDVGIGELRNNYAGFFDPGFGFANAAEAPSGTPAVLEVRAHDVPFLVEDGQVFFRLRFFRACARPARLYGEDRLSYRAQDLTLARPFRALGAP